MEVSYLLLDQDGSGMGGEKKKEGWHSK